MPFVQCLDVDANTRTSMSSLAEAAKSEGLTYAAVTKLLERSEMYSNPKAVDAVRAEGKALVEAGTWNESTVIEKADLIRKAKETHEQIHLGELMSIASIKFYELPADQHKYKGRICFRGDIVRDEHGVAAIFQELSSNPTNVHDANAN